jgi:hypothetical protein
VDSGEVKSRLGRALHRPITPAEWRHLERTELVAEYLRDGNWREFRELAATQLEQIRSFYRDKISEESGDLLDVYPGHNANDDEPLLPVDPEDRTSARMYALGALNRLRAGDSAVLRAATDAMLLPRGGVDGTLPQWVYIVAVEMWMPAEKVAEHYRQMQRTMMAEPDQPRTQARAFNVARFVWEQERFYGERPPWPVMCERWNNYPLTRPFKNWRDFRTNFLRGAKATPPRYVATEEQLTEQVRSHVRDQAGLFYYWADKVLAATVQQRAD